MSDSASPQAVKQADLQRSYGTNWTKTNVTTLNEWITIAAYNIQILTYASQYHQRLLRNNIILGLILSTASGTISAARFGLTANAMVDTILNGLFTAMSFIIATFTGCLKVYSIQERLEEFLRIKQDWIVFSTAIASELQLPIELRHDALYLIVKYKAKYLDMLKANPDVPAFCVAQVKSEFGSLGDTDVDATNLPKTMMGIAKLEMAIFDHEERHDQQAPLLPKGSCGNRGGLAAVAVAAPLPETVNATAEAFTGAITGSLTGTVTRPPRGTQGQEVRTTGVNQLEIKPATPSAPLTLTVPYVEVNPDP